MGVVGVTVADDSDMQPVDVTMRNVTALQCAEVRRRVLAVAGRAGLDDDQARQYALAVNEIVINAVTHGGGAASVVIQSGEGHVVVEVHDRGAGIGTMTGELPPPDAVGGRGIWLARQLCDEVTISSGDNGTVVRLATVARSSPEPDRCQSGPDYT